MSRGIRVPVAVRARGCPHSGCEVNHHGPPCFSDVWQAKDLHEGSFKGLRYWRRGDTEVAKPAGSAPEGDTPRAMRMVVKRRELREKQFVRV